MCDDKFEKIFDGFLVKPPFFEELADKYLDVTSSCLRKHSTRPTAVEVRVIMSKGYSMF